MMGVALVVALGILQASPQSEPDAVKTALAVFESARSGEGNLFQPGNVVERLKTMKPADVSEDVWNLDMATALNSAADPVIASYTTGDEAPQPKTAYERCAALYEASNDLSPNPESQARMWFCRGRSALADRNFDKAVEDFKKSIDAAPNAGGYHYNSLGVAYLEQGLLPEAKEQFDKAISHEGGGMWTYPLHNLAIASMEDGDYGGAQKEYRLAIEKAGSGQLTGYLHYNLGIIEYELARKSDAQEWQNSRTRRQLQMEAQCEFETALKSFGEEAGKGPKDSERSTAYRGNEAEAYNALGALWKSEGRRKEAEEAYRRSLELKPELEAARTNLRLLLGSSGKETQPYTHILLEPSCGERPCSCEAAK
jgi:tetratricopeptide (TPR) repeat protein